ncbi:MAG: Na/Pi cotransporter family protein [Lachnospiraceae bacterium]|nr:Na/Pi cotransporter family protein [Lachnospiraceae bacterium]
MSTREIISLLGGLALFLYGMQMMSGGLEAAAGNQMQQFLKRLTANRFLGMAAGAAITALVQSSTATTVMVVGFVNSEMMTLRQAMWIIIGANIGTTVTSQLIAIDAGVLAPLIVFVGVVLVIFFKKPRCVYAGQIIAGLGILFLGMDMIMTAMLSLRGSQGIIGFIEYFSNPFLGVLVGTIMTAIVQSSSVSVAILQAMAMEGLVSLEGAVFVLFGNNIGTCITALLASVGGSQNAKRAASVHLIFNIFGTVIFIGICRWTPLVPLMENLMIDSAKAQIAMIHTLFNILTALLLFPVGEWLAVITEKIIPNQKTDHRQEKHVEYLQPAGQPAGGKMGTSAIYLNQVHQEVMRMLEMVEYNVDKAFWAFRVGDEERLEEVNETEQYIDYLNKEISQHISKTIGNEPNEKDIFIANQYYKIAGNVEQIGDCALNIAEYTSVLQEKKIKFSKEAQAEMERMEQVLQVFFETLDKSGMGGTEWTEKVAWLGQNMNDMAVQYREALAERMRRGICSVEACMVYSEMLTDFKRIGDHALELAKEMQMAADT